MREIVFDTETTGFDFPNGDRMVEIGCVELVNRVETGRTFHAYFHPERDMPIEAERVHGLKGDFLAKFPVFSARAAELLEFIADTPLIAHNAGFDFGFLNGELGRCGHPIVSMSRMVDTLSMARSRHPGAKHSLDALCTRFGIDRSHRVQHGALLDAQLLAQVYVELMGGRQIGLGLTSAPVIVGTTATEAPARRAVRAPRHFAPGAGDLARHAAFMKGIANPIWGADAYGRCILATRVRPEHRSRKQMDIRVSGHQVDTGEALKAHVTDRLQGIADKYFARAISAEVTFGRGPHDVGFKCDIVAHVTRGLVLKGRHDAQEAHPAFDGAAAKIETQLRRYTRRLKDRHADEAIAIAEEGAYDNAGYTLFQESAGEDEVGDAPLIVAETRVDVPDASVSDAVMMLDLRNTAALLFRNAGTGAYNMVYRRGDGTIGWVEPQREAQRETGPAKQSQA